MHAIAISYGSAIVIVCMLQDDCHVDLPRKELAIITENAIHM